MTYLPIQQSFIGGVISPKLSGMTESPRYGLGLKSCENFQITPQGSMRLRNGSRYLADADTQTSRLYNYSRAGRSDTVVEISENVVKIYDINGNVIVQDFENSNFLADAGFYQGFGVWSPSSNFTVSGEWPEEDRIDYAFGLPYAIYKEPTWQQPRSNGSGGIRLSTKVFSQITTPSGIPFSGESNIQGSVSKTIESLEQEVTVANPAESHTIKFDLYNRSLGGGALEAYSLTTTIKLINPATGSVIFTNATLFNSSSPLNELKQISFTVTPNLRVFKFVIELKLELINSGTLFGAAWQANKSVEIENLSLRQTNASNIEASYTSPYTGVDLRLIQSAYDTGTGLMIFTHPDVEPYEIQETGFGTFAFGKAFSQQQIDNFPVAWNEFAYPAVCEFYQGRLWLANIRSADNSDIGSRSTIWASKVAEYKDFVIEQTGSTALEFKLSTNGVIQWLRGSKSLLIGTDSSEWVASSSTGIITSEDFKFTEQSRLGSKSNVAPQYAGDQVVYAGLDARRVRATNFDIALTDSWIAQELSFQAEHLLNARIVDMAYARDPDYQLAIVTGDGQLAICMNDRVQDLNAWYTFKTDGYYKAVEYSNNPAGSSLWVVVERPEGNFIERFNTNIDDEAHLDSYVRKSLVYTGDENGVGGFSGAFNSGFDGQGKDVYRAEGIDHFEQQTVQLVVERINDDNPAIPSYQSFIGDIYIYLGKGKIPFEEGMVSALIGKKFLAEAVTWPAEIPSQRGTTQGSKQHMSRIFSRCINNSAYPILNGYRPIAENPRERVLDSTITGDIEIRNEGTLEKSVVTIKQDIPLNTEIAGIFGKISNGVT